MSVCYLLHVVHSIPPHKGVVIMEEVEMSGLSLQNYLRERVRAATRMTLQPPLNRPNFPRQISSLVKRYLPLIKSWRKEANSRLTGQLPVVRLTMKKI